MIPPSPALLHRSDSLKAELSALRADFRASAAEIDRANRQRTELRRQIAELESALSSETAGREQQAQELAVAQSRLQHARSGLLQLEVDIQKTEAQKPNIKTLKHVLTPLSREIQGKELHFRLLGNKVAYLPIQELMDRLRPQITEQRDRLIREGVLRGDVGPVAGFRMDYVMRVQRLSAIDQLRQGASMRIGVSEWQLVAESELETESADDALKDGSEFLRILGGADPDTTITFWVYPDSFSVYRRLQEFAHGENFTVAARPLPYGVPIAGSPQGSRSSGQ